MTRHRQLFFVTKPVEYVHTLLSQFGLSHECTQQASIPIHSSLPDSCKRLASITTYVYTNLTTLSIPLPLAVFDGQSFLNTLEPLIPEALPLSDIHYIWNLKTNI